MTTIFFGNFHNLNEGTKSITQKLIEKLESENIGYCIGSKQKNRILRVFEIIFKTIFYKYDNIHIDAFSDNAFNIVILISILNLLRKKYLILNIRGGKFINFYEKNRFNKIKIKLVFDRANKIISPSNYLTRYFIGLDFKVNFLPNFISLNKFPYNSIIISNKKLLWVRAFSKIYNPTDAIRTLMYLLEKKLNFSLTMIGSDKGLLTKTNNLIDKLNLNDKVNIVGPVKNELLYKYYQNHFALINTTSYESFGQSLIEASACGCPIISNKVGEIPYTWTDRHDMIFAESRNSKNMADKIIQLYEDIDMRKKIKKNAYNKIKDYDWEILKHDWFKILKIENNNEKNK